MTEIIQLYCNLAKYATEQMNAVDHTPEVQKKH